jgi:hypothetical protein
MISIKPSDRRGDAMQHLVLKLGDFKSLEYCSGLEGQWPISRIRRMFDDRSITDTHACLKEGILCQLRLE